jgi:hypothetical protein
VHGLLEKHLTLDVALRVKREIERRGRDSVVLTRASDINPAASERVLTAHNLNAEVFVSIHFNASDRHDAQGTETWVHQFASNTGTSAALCRAVQAGVLRATGLSDRNRHHPPHFIKKAKFCVLDPDGHRSRTAAVLVEVSFLDRADEEGRLLRDSYKDEIAIGLVNGIESYFGVEPDVERAPEEMPEVEDAIALAAAMEGAGQDHGAEVESGAAAGPEAVEIPGYALPDEDRGERAGTGEHVLRRLLTESLISDTARLSAPSENDAEEFSTIAIGEAPDFANAAIPSVAEAIVDGILVAPDADEFDFMAFKTFIDQLELRHFTATEFLFLGAGNQSGRCAGRNSLPPRSLWPNITNTARMLDRIRAELGSPVRILSCYRSEAYNSCIRGEPGSLHKRFNAIDWHCSSGTVREWQALARRVRASDSSFSGGIGFYPRRNFIHIDTRGRNAEWTGS